MRARLKGKEGGSLVEGGAGFGCGGGRGGWRVGEGWRGKVME